MRVVNDPEDLPALFTQAQSEAGSAFSSADVYLEKFIGAPRHIEFQVLADEHGNVEILGERECSIQRRHQKLLEESPSPAVTRRGSAQRSPRRCASAIARAGYTNAGTVEFLMDETGQALLHRGERARAGGASGHRVRHRHRHRQEPDPHRAGRDAAGDPARTGASCAATPSSAASTRKIRRPSCRRPGASPASICPAASGSGWTRGRTPTA